MAASAACTFASDLRRAAALRALMRRCGYGIAWLCRVLNIRRNAYHAWLKRKPACQAKAAEDARITEKIRCQTGSSGARGCGPA